MSRPILIVTTLILLTGALAIAVLSWQSGGLLTASTISSQTIADQPAPAAAPTTAEQADTPTPQEVAHCQQKTKLLVESLCGSAYPEDYYACEQEVLATEDECLGLPGEVVGDDQQANPEATSREVADSIVTQFEAETGNRPPPNS